MKSNSITLNSAQYFDKLLSKHASSSKINEFLNSINSSHQQRIQDGQTSIQKSNRTQHSRTNAHLPKKQGRYNDSPKQQHGKKVILNDEQRLKFIKQMMKERNQIEVRKQKQIKQLESKARKSQEKEKEKQQRQSAQRREQRRQQLHKKIQQINEEARKREQNLKMQNKEYQQKAKEKLLLHKMEDNFNQIQNASLQEKKRKLAEIRQLHKPLSKQEFQSHLNKIAQLKQLKEKERASTEQKSFFTSNKRPQFYKSAWYKRAENEDKLLQIKKAQEEIESLKEKKDKQKKYAEYIRLNFKPQPDERKSQQLQRLMSNDGITRKNNKEIRDMGLNNLKYSKEHAISKEELLERSQDKTAHLLAPPPPPPNYLQDFKKKRSQSTLPSSSVDYLTKIQQSTSLTQREKASRLIDYATKLQYMAKQKQQLLKIKKEGLDEEVDDMYLKALSAKLKVLGTAPAQGNLAAK